LFKKAGKTKLTGWFLFAKVSYLKSDLFKLFILGRDLYHIRRKSSPLPPSKGEVWRLSLQLIIQALAGSVTGQVGTD